MIIIGKNIIAGNPSAEGERTFSAINPLNGETLAPLIYDATTDEIHRALSQAEKAFEIYQKKEPLQISLFLEELAYQMEINKDLIIERAQLETSLGIPRLEGEMKRTINQIHMFSSEVKEGTHLDVRIDTAIPDREPIPKPDIRQTYLPIGPVVVFSASNFPLAFSVVGGDTISALAAGNPVIVKAHPNHPGTSELVAKVILHVIHETNMPMGLFSLIQGKDYQIGRELVTHPITRAVAFTGSLEGGRALFNAGASRPEPIPVYAEMGSINPVFLLPGAIESKGDNISELLCQSVTLGAGQFCTNPGLIIGIRDKNFTAWIKDLSNHISQASAQVMLTPQMCEAYQKNLQEFLKIDGVNPVDQIDMSKLSSQSNTVQPTVLTVDATTFIQHPLLSREIFGPCTLVVQCDSNDALKQIAKHLEGQLTITLHAEKKDMEIVNQLLPIVIRKAGRLLWGGAPTGVEVCPSMFHGGPYPATTDGRTTSVGTAAIQRFLRPVCFQNYPEELLPPELHNQNKRQLWRLVNNKRTKEDI